MRKKLFWRDVQGDVQAWGYVAEKSRTATQERKELPSFIGGKTCAEPTWWLTHVRVNDGKARHYLGIMIFNDIGSVKTVFA